MCVNSSNKHVKYSILQNRVSKITENIEKSNYSSKKTHTNKHETMDNGGFELTALWYEHLHLNIGPHNHLFIGKSIKAYQHTSTLDHILLHTEVCLD